MKMQLPVSCFLNQTNKRLPIKAHRKAFMLAAPAAAGKCGQARLAAGQLRVSSTNTQWSFSAQLASAAPPEGANTKTVSQPSKAV